MTKARDLADFLGSGADIAGTITADALTVDTNTLHVDAANNLVGIGTSSPDTALTVSVADNTMAARFKGANGIFRVLPFETGLGVKITALNGNETAFETLAYQADDHQFVTGITERMRITSSGDVGIGVSSPASGYLGRAALDVQGPVVARGAVVAHQTDAGVFQYNANETTIRSYGATSNSGQIVFTTGGGGTLDTERMRIDASGNVGIGTASLAGGNAPLTIGNVGGTGAQINFRNAAANDAYIGLSGDANGDLIHYIGATSDQIFSTSGTERMRIDSSGNVGIGTSSPSYRLSLGGTTGRKFAVYDDSGSGIASGLGVDLAGSSYELSFWSGNASGGVGQFTWGQMNTTTGAYSEKMRLDASGKLLVGCTAALSFGSGTTTGVMIEPFTLVASRANESPLYLQRSGSDGGIAYFYKGTSSVGSISVTTSATSYNTSSDYRLKEDVQPMVGASDRVLSLNPVNFAWKADGSRTDGFLAHEAQAVVPEAVHGEKDAVDADGNPVYQGIDQSKLVPLLTAALQEALTEIANLKARVAALEA